jgi:predicted subunit of tRNA(5-methylaminomethyl-2-thiouridylate) methyltransferase
MMWDDNDRNEMQEGDVLGFWKYQDCVEFHRVERSLDPIHRPASWIEPKHADRRVLVLSPQLCVVHWEHWGQFQWYATGYPRDSVQVASAQARIRMIRFINESLRPDGSLSIVYPNQKVAFDEIMKAFRECHWVTLIAFPQSGKTDVFLYVACEMLSTRQELEKAVVVCGNAELELSDQLKKDMHGYTTTEGEEIAGFIRKYVNAKWNGSEAMVTNLTDRITLLCGGDLQREIDSDMDQAQNTLFIWEEAHYAQDKTNRPHKYFEKCGITADGEPSNLEGERNNYVLTVSATPFSEISNQALLGQNKRLVYMQPSNLYKGPRQFREAGGIMPFDSELESQDILEQAISHVPETGSPKYAIMRLRHDQLELCVQKAQMLSWNYRLYDSVSRLNVEDPNCMQSLEELKVAPERNTVVFIKGMCRMGKRVEKKHISFVIESSKESNTDTVLQGLMGRMFGHHDFMNIKIWISNRIELAEIERYERLMEAGPLVEMPLYFTNSVGADKEWFPNIPILVRPIIQNDDDFRDPNAEEYRNDLIRQSIRHAFDSNTIEDQNCPEQRAEIRQHISQLLSLPDDSFGLYIKSFMKTNGRPKRCVDQEIPNKLRESLDQATPFDYKGLAGSFFPRTLELPIIVWECNTSFFSQSLRFGSGYLIVHTRTRAAAPLQRIPGTTGLETFKPQRVDGAAAGE